MFNLGVNRWNMVLRTAHTQNGKGNENLSSNVHLCSPSFPTVEFKHFMSVTHFRGRNLGCRGIVPLHGHPRTPFWSDETSLGLLSAHCIVIALWKYKHLPFKMKHQQNAQEAHFLVQTRLWTGITLPINLCMCKEPGYGDMAQLIAGMAITQVAPTGAGRAWDCGWGGVGCS